MFTASQLQAFYAEACRYRGSADHQRLDQLSLSSPSVQQWYNRNSSALQVRQHGRNPANHAHVGYIAAITAHLLAECIPDYIDGMLSGQARIEPRQDVPAKILDRYAVRRMSEVADEQDPIPVRSMPTLGCKLDR